MFSFRLIFIFLLLAHTSALAHAEPAPSAPAAVAPVQTYAELLGAIRHVQSSSQLRVQQVAKQEKVRTAWETGKLIDEHVLQHKERADYADKTIVKLSKDLGLSKTELWSELEFSRAYPMFPTLGVLGWSHYRALLALNDPKVLAEIDAKASDEKWSIQKLRKEISKLKNSTGDKTFPKKQEKLTATLGKPYTYKIVKATAGTYKGQLVISLGFWDYYLPGVAGVGQPKKKIIFTDGEIVRVEKGGIIRNVKGGKESDLYTYEASIIEIIDGDTLKVAIDLGFGINIVQKLRLRGLDAPELVSKEGVEAKEFLKQLLASGPVLVRTSRSDKYDRYLADVFVGAKYVNQELIEKDFAVLVEE